MTGVPKLQHLPVPAASAGALAVAAPGTSGGRAVKAVQPVAPTRRSEPETERGGIRPRDTGARHAEDGAGRGEPRGAAADQLAGDAVAGRQLSFSRLSSMPFMVQLLGQQSATGRGLAALPTSGLAGHRDAALIGSDLYRRSGGEPEILPDGATFVRLAV